jgi:hypothetical protein
MFCIAHFFLQQQSQRDIPSLSGSDPERFLLPRLESIANPAFGR